MGPLDKPELIKAAKADLNKALTIISQDELCGRLNLEELVDVISSHRELISHIVSDQAVLSSFGGQLLANLAKIDADIALQFVKDFANKLVGHDLMTLGKDHLNVAKQIYDTPDLSRKLSSYQQVELCKKHPNLSREVFLDNVSTLKLKATDFVRLAATRGEYIDLLLEQVETVKHCVSNYDDLKKEQKELPELYKHMDSDLVALLGQYSKSHALAFLEEERFAGCLQGMSYATIARYHIDVARKVLNMNDVNNQVGPLGIAAIASYHEDIATEILDKKYPVVLDRTILSVIGGKYPALSDIIYNDDTLRTILETGPMGKVVDKATRAQAPIMHPEIQLAEHNEELAIKLVENSHRRGAYSAPELVKLGKNHRIVARKILSTPQLKNKLSKDDVVDMISRHSDLLEETIGKDCPVTDLERVGLLCRQSLSVSSTVANADREKLQISKSYHELLQQRVAAATQIRDTIMTHYTIGDSYEPLERGKLLNFLFRPVDAHPCHLKPEEVQKLYGRTRKKATSTS